tara:strand:- start:999 stop:1421 length:423 start_codon:yes stop_codon:yes gene_type:complete
MTEALNYDSKLFEFCLNTTTRYTQYHKKFILSKLYNTPQHTYKELNKDFLKDCLLLKTSRERYTFHKCIKILDFCNKYYTIYLCKQILDEFEINYGFEVHKRFFLNSKKFLKNIECINVDNLKITTNELIQILNSNYYKN